MRLYLLSILLLATWCPPVWAQDSPPPLTRARLYQMLLAAKVFNPDRQLVHLSHTGNLHIDGQSFPVVDMQELVKGAVVPRGVNQIIILSPALKPLHKIEYTTQRPLFCLDDRLYVWGDIAIGNIGPEGNVLTFKNHGRDSSLSHVEANDLPVPPTRDRKQPIQ